MGDALTQLSSLSFDQAAYQRMAYFALRSELIYDQFATVQPTRQSMPGTSVVFTIVNDLAAATSAISETADVDAVALSDSTVTVTLAEYGNAVLTTAKIRATSFVEIDPVVANVVGYNAGDSIDQVAMAVIQAGSNVIYATGGADTPTSRKTIETEDVLAGDDVRLARAQLRKANVAPFGSGYAGIIHPDVSYDFRGATGATNWRDPHIYSSPEGIWMGEIGMFEGVRFVETPRAPLFADAGDGAGGAGTIDAYGTLVMGQQCFAKAHGIQDGYTAQPQIVMGNVVDKLRRFVPIGWKHLVGYAVFRQAALRRIESTSSIGANT